MSTLIWVPGVFASGSRRTVVGVVPDCVGVFLSPKDFLPRGFGDCCPERVWLPKSSDWPIVNSSNDPDKSLIGIGVSVGVFGPPVSVAASPGILEGVVGTVFREGGTRRAMVLIKNADTRSFKRVPPKKKRDVPNKSSTNDPAGTPDKNDLQVSR